MNRTIRWMITAAAWIGLWQLTYLAMEKELIVPSFLHTVKALGVLLASPLFYESAGATMLRVVTGMTASFFLGAVSSLLSYRFLFFRRQFSGIVAVIKSTPVLAVVLYLVLWMPSDHVPGFVCFLMCYPVVYTNLLTGLDAMDKKLLEMAAVYGLSKKKQIRALYLPSVKPQIRAALSLTAGLSWKTVVAGEVLSIPQYSMGYHLMESKLYFQTDQLFAWMICIIILSICFEQLVKAAVRWI